MLKIFILVFLISVPLESKAQTMDSLLVKSPPKAFFKRYHQNLFAWLKKKYIKSSNISSLEECFSEWIETKEGSSEVFLDGAPLKPFLISYEKDGNTSGWYITLISKSPLNCLNHTFGAKWTFSGKQVSNFYWEKPKGTCEQAKQERVLFETQGDGDCIEWRLDKNTKTKTTYHGMQAYAKIDILKGDQSKDLVFYHNYNPFLLGDVPGPVLLDFKWSWRALVRGVYFINPKEYSLYLP